MLCKKHMGVKEAYGCMLIVANHMCHEVQNVKWHTCALWHGATQLNIWAVGQ